MKRAGRNWGTAIVMLAALPGATGPAWADAAAGRAIAEEVCQQCHGLNGVALVEEAPNLSGQKRDYLINQLWAFRSGVRSNPTMSPSAIELSDQDIIDVADWYTSITFTVEMPLE